MKKVNYAKLLTEQNNPRSRSIDSLSIEQIIGLMNREDQSIPRIIQHSKKQIAQAVRLIVKSLKQGGRLFFAGAGTSGRLGVIEAAECPPTFNTPPFLVQAVMAGGKKAVFRSQEGAEDRKDEAQKIFSQKLKKGDVCVGIAASGVTPFVQGAFAAARKKGAATILLCCTEASTFKSKVDCIISLKVGPEIITGSTRLKAGTATKLALNMLTVTSMIQLGKVYQNWMVDLQPKSKKLHARALRLIEHLGGVSKQEAERYLLQSKKKVKTAILMARKKWDYSKASQKLKQSSGFLHEAIHS